jgi:membrane protein DedA with SNARE-associated domain
LQSIVTFLEHNAAVAIVVTLLAAASESLVVVGAFIPGTALILALGAAAGLGYIPLWPLVIAAIIGAIVGDGLSLLDRAFTAAPDHLGLAVLITARNPPDR